VPKASRLLAPIVEEAIGLVTTLIPEPKVESPRVSLEDIDLDLTMSNIRTMKDLISEVKSKTTCPKCLEHCENIERELSELERKYPTYQRVNKLRKQLRELLELIKPGAELPLLPETKKPSEA